MPRNTTPPTHQELQVYVDLLPDELFDDEGSLTLEHSQIFSITPHIFARLLFNLHQEFMPCRGVAPHSSSKRFELIAGILRDCGLIDFDQYKMRWELSEASVEALGEPA